MAVADELIVALKSEGAQETKDEVQGVSDQMEETAATTEETADELEGFSNEFGGALGAATAALAVGAAGLLSKVPVIGEAMSGLFSIAEALAFQMDGVLRPVLGPISNLFFSISERIFNAEGAFGTLIGVVSTIVSLAAVAIPIIAKVGAFFGVWASTGAGVLSILGTLAGAIATVITTIVSLPVVIAAAIAALLALAFIYREEIANAIGTALSTLSEFASGAIQTFLDLASDLASWASDLASRAVDWGLGVVEGFLDGLSNFADKVQEKFLGVVNRIIQTVNRLVSALPDKIASRVGIEGGFDTIDIDGINGDGGGGGDGGGIGSGFLGSVFGGGGGGSQIDGRQLSESTGRYRAGPSRRRGI